MKVGNATVHGFRSSFRDWAGECTSVPREIAEAALAHVVGDETERAYRRGDALEKRRKLMEEWAGFLAGSQAAGTVAPAALGSRAKVDRATSPTRRANRPKNRTWHSGWEPGHRELVSEGPS